LKRSLLTAAAIYLLYDRQRRVERRILERQQAFELRTLSFADEVSTELTDFAKAYREWTDDLLKQLKKALTEGAR
jgi:hypothetical protein